MPTTPTRGRRPGLLINPDSVQFALGDRPQTWLAAAAQSSPAHLSEILCGKKAVTEEVAGRLAAALECPVGMLFPELVQFRTQVRHFTAPKYEQDAA
jgi:transcriptional regulator with XRE-family HTH domain